MGETRSYGHFCMIAASLDQVGDRWTLLVVRDLAGGPRRFTDLMERLGAITPKTLTQRLRDLEERQIVHADREPGRREVWYSLTAAGKDLLPVLDDLLRWGLRHTLRPPRPGEAAHPEHLLLALRVQLEDQEIALPPVRWLLRLLDGSTYVISNDTGRWSFTESEAGDPDVVVTATRDGWARFLTSSPDTRTTGQPDVRIAGEPAAVATFMNAVSVFPFGPQAGSDDQPAPA